MMIKVLVATSKTQGARDNDYNWCIEQELVWFPPICRSSKVNGPDDSCGCGRGFGGLNSHRATTTAMVQTIEGLSRRDYVEAIRSSMDDQGYDASPAGLIADAMLEMVREWPDGAVVENRLEYIQIREPVS